MNVLKENLITSSQDYLSKINNITDFMENVEKGNKKSILYSGSTIQIQIQSMSEKSLKESRENKMPIIDYTGCENMLKQKNLIDKNEKLFSFNIVYNQDAFNILPIEAVSKSKTIIPQLVDSKGKKIDTSICNNIEVKSPINSNIVNGTQYEEIFYEKGINIFNSSEPIFYDKCTKFQYKDNTDYSLEYRRKKFPLTGTCSDGGKFIGLDEFHYSICEYDNFPKESSTNFKKKVFDSLLNSNFRLYLCIKETFKETVKNISFWMFISFSLITLFTILLHSLIFDIKKNIDVIFKSDVITIDPKLIGKVNTNSRIIIPIKTGNEKENLKSLTKINIETKCLKKITFDNKNYIESSNTMNPDNFNKSQIFSNSKFISKDSVNISYIPKNVGIDENDNSNNNNLNLSVHEVSMGSNFENITQNNSNFNQNNNTIIVNNMINSEFRINEINEQDKEPIEQFNKNVMKENSDEIKLKTDADFNSLPIYLKMKLDKRTILNYLWHLLIEKIEIMNLLLITSAIRPFHIRTFQLLLIFTIEFTLNAMFYSDKIVDNQTDLKSSGKKVNFGWVILEEFSKSLWPVLIQVAIMILTNFIIRVPKEYLEEFNISMNSNNDENVKQDTM